CSLFLLFHDPLSPDSYPLSLHDALPISVLQQCDSCCGSPPRHQVTSPLGARARSAPLGGTAVPYGVLPVPVPPSSVVNKRHAWCADPSRRAIADRLPGDSSTAPTTPLLAVVCNAAGRYLAE